MIKQAINYWSKHVILANTAHAAGGAGLIIVLQHYLAGNSFVSVAIGWILLAFFAVTHLVAYTNKSSR